MVAFNDPLRPRKPRFPLGQVVATPAALDALRQAGQRPDEFLARHHVGDWGEVSDDDRQANNRAVEDAERLLSVYTLTTGVNLWVITEADRSATTLLLPEDY